jgi:putative membrane protein
MNRALWNNVIWLLVAGYFLWVLADSFFHPTSSGVSATVNVFFMISIATLHGLRRYSLKEFLIFFVITFIVSNFYENLSILTGFPFGHYHYTEALGPKLFLVPLLMPPRILDAAT